MKTAPHFPKWLGAAGVVALLPVIYLGAFFPLASLEARCAWGMHTSGFLCIYRPLPEESKGGCWFFG